MTTTAYSTVNGSPLHCGKQAATPLRSGTVRYADLRAPLVRAGLLPRIPVRYGHANSFRNWGMHGNGPDNSVFPGFQGCGDCAWGGPANSEEEAAFTAGRPAPNFTGKVIVEQYSEYSGYNPETGENDTGSNPQDVFAYRQTQGLRDTDGNRYKIGQVVALEPGNLTEMFEAAYLFEDCGIGIIVTEAQDIQFAEHQAWDYVAGSPELGGHWVEVMGRPGPGFGSLITWAQRKRFTTAFYEQQNDEAYAWLDNERYSKVTGHTAENFSNQDLEKYLYIVAQQKGGAPHPITHLSVAA